MARKPKIKSAQTNIIFFMFITSLSGCVTGPTGMDYREFKSRPEFQNDLNGQIIIENKTGETMSGVRWQDENDVILSDIKRSGKKFVESDKDGKKFKFTYYPCVDTGYTPTNSAVGNTFIGIMTIGFWPTGKTSTCKTDLDVISTDGQTSHFSTELNIERTVTTLAAFNFGFKEQARWKLPARRLLKMYEGKSTTGMVSKEKP